MNNKHTIATIISCFCLLTSCAHRTPNELTQIANLKAIKAESSVDDMRLDSVKEAAATLGAQSGLAWRMKQINEIITKASPQLNKIFNFRHLMLEHQVVPPVLITADNTVNMGGGDTLRVAEKTYAIAIGPRFASSPPNWESYLLVYYEKPERPDNTLLPKTKDEAIAWNKAIIKSWKSGIDQANQIFESNLSLLNRDYKGMLLYRMLLSQKMITPPFVAETSLGVTGSPDEIRLNDKILRITKSSSLVTDASSWKATVQNTD